MENYKNNFDVINIYIFIYLIKDITIDYCDSRSRDLTFGA